MCWILSPFFKLLRVKPREPKFYGCGWWIQKDTNSSGESWPLYSILTRAQEMLIFQTPPNWGSEMILTQLSDFLESARGVLEITLGMGRLQSKCMDLKESAASVFFSALGWYVETDGVRDLLLAPLYSGVPLAALQFVCQNSIGRQSSRSGARLVGTKED